MRVLRRRAALDRAGLHAAGAPRLDGRADPARGAGLRRREPRAGRRDRHERPVPERRAPERHQPDLAGARRRRAARLRREPRPPRRRRRRRAGVDRRVPRGVPGGRDHPAGQARRGGRARRRRVRADPRADPLQARDGAATCARRSPRTSPASGGCRRSSSGTAARRSSTTMDELLAYTERRTRAELAALPHGVYEAEGSVDVDGYTDEPVRLRRASSSSADGVRFDLAGSDPQRRAPVNSTYAQTFSACAYAVKCLIDPDLPVNDGFYRLVTRRRAARQRHELHVAEPGRRRLGDADAARRHDLPRAPAGAAGAAAGGDEGDDVPRRLRRRRPGERRATTASSRRSAAATAGARRATGPTRCRRTGRTPRTRRSRRPS